MIGPRKVDKPLILYGAGKLGGLAVGVLGRLSIPIHAVTDRGDIGFAGEKVKRECLLAICIATVPYKTLVDPLVAAGWKDIVSIYDIFEAYPECGITSGWYVGENPMDSFEAGAITARWTDPKSMLHFLAFYNWHNARIETFGVQIDTEDRWAIPEVMAVFHDHEHILRSHEGSTLADIEERRHTVGIWHNWAVKYTYIQLHCEGFELESIKKSMAYFQCHRPIIAVTVYHTRDGLWKIEKELMDNLSDYEFYFRLHAYQGQGAIMYCIPRERRPDVA